MSLALVGFLGVLVGGLLSYLTHHVAWLRQQRITAYGGMMGTFITFESLAARASHDAPNSPLPSLPHGFAEVLERVRVAVETAGVVVSPEGVDAIDAASRLVGDAVDGLLLAGGSWDFKAWEARWHAALERIRQQARLDVRWYPPISR